MERQTNTYLPENLIDEAFSAKEVARCTAGKREAVYVAVDPPSHQRSNFGIMACCYGSMGEYIMLGGGEISAQRCEVLQVQATVGEFLRRLRGHAWVKTRIICPIIECNNNEILANAILSVFNAHGPIQMPFVTRYFSESIADQVGVLTTEKNKVAMLHGCYSALLDNRIHFATQCVSVNKAAYQFSAADSTFAATKELLAKELKAFRDLPNGKISGRMTDGMSDDIGMAFLMVM